MAKSAKKAKRPTPNRIEYNKQVARIRKFINRAEKRGYIIDESVKSKLNKKLDVVRKRDIESLKKLTPSKLYEKSYRIDVSTGELTPGTQARAEERRQVSLKSAATRRANKQAEMQFFTGKSSTVPTKGLIQPVENKDLKERIAKKRAQQKKPHTVPKGQFNPEDYPDGGEVILDNFTDAYLSKYADTNLLDHYLDELGKPASRDYTNMQGNKRKRGSAAISSSDSGRRSILSFIRQLIQENGKSKVGWLIQEHADELSPLLDYVLYGSDSEVIAATTSRVITILKNFKMGTDELIDYGQNDEEYEDYDV